MKPKILVVASEGYAKNIAHFMINTDYGEAVASSGGLPIVALSSKLTNEYFEIADALLLTDGCEIHRGRYGEYYSPDEPIPPLCQEREDMEFVLCEMFAKSSKPILGIGRGMKIVNVFFGGTLCESDTVAIEKLGDNLSASYAEDGTIESISHDKLPILGVMNFEKSSKQSFDWLISECKEVLK